MAEEEKATNASNENMDKKNPNTVKKISIEDLIKGVFDGYGSDATEDGKKRFNQILTKYLKQEASKNNCYKEYNIVVLYDESTLVKGDADSIYNAVTKFTDEKKPLLLILYSRGGSAASAYLIGKLCREYSDGSFVVSVPRFAKSAATLITCGANEVHMGSLSELGPIDPQINRLPALGLKNSVEHIAELAKRYPEASDMFAKYLKDSLPLINLGYYERVAESAVQYAEKLLNTHSHLLPKEGKDIAYELVYKYKDHGFVIDSYEAMEIFGEKIIKSNTDEYQLGNTIYKALDMVSRFFGFLNYDFYFIGSFDSEANVIKRAAAND
ncbi:serine dehydrogenase proteinase [Marinilabilia salmonicolor]|jgi:hypothetical protein|uniref:SDH family Clp fold serine proteinase n=1 Tax=Marinilabilia salmonicolor TaxID=989 RepID=UPI000D08017B|nr:hypothetical protein [Marinilabilia salmonicolor]PRY90329.1 serine dehydrogenase proteinase [Marinilabilia salmonicolor]